MVIIALIVLVFNNNMFVSINLDLVPYSNVFTTEVKQRVVIRYRIIVKITYKSIKLRLIELMKTLKRFYTHVKDKFIATKLHNGNCISNKNAM